MREFKNKVAVITGAASGIGKALALRSFKEGMKVVIADIESECLNQVKDEMEREGASVLSVVTDVSKYKDVQFLANKTVKEFGAVHLLFNNAGVASGVPILYLTLKDWEWILRVNLFGVIHGIHAFLPIMQAQDVECHIVNTSSVFGIIPGGGAYGVSKYGITALTENLYEELKVTKSKIRISVLLPSAVNTNILHSERNRCEEFKNDPSEELMDPEVKAWLEENQANYELIFKKGMNPDIVVDIVFQGIKEQRFYIFTDKLIKMVIKKRDRQILKDLDETPSQ